MTNGAWVDICAADGTTKQGDGPIVSLTDLKYTARLDKPGSFDLTMPCADPRVQYLKSKEILRAYGIVNGAITELGSGIIDQLVTTAGTPPMLEVIGDDMMRELTYKSVGNLALNQATTFNADFLQFIGGTVGTVTPLPDPPGVGLPYSYPGIFTNQNWMYVGATGKTFEQIQFGDGPGGGCGGGYWGTWDVQYYNAAKLSWDAVAVLTNTTITYDGPGGTARWFATGGTITFSPCPNWGMHDGTHYALRFRPQGGNTGLKFGGLVLMNHIGVADGLARIMAFAPAGWSATGVTSLSTVNMQFAGESVLTALQLLAAQCNDHFRLSTTFRQIEWLQAATTDSGIHAIAPTADPGLDANNDIAIITALQQTQDSYPLASRVYAHGGGTGPSRPDLSLCNISMPTGYVRGQNASTGLWYIERTAANTYFTGSPTNPLEIDMSFSDVVPLNSNNDQCILASNALAQRTLNWLAVNSATQDSDVPRAYTMTLEKCEALLRPAQTIRTQYDHFADAYHDVAIDAQLEILEATTEVQFGVPRTVALTVSTVPRYPVAESRLLTMAIQGGQQVATRSSNYTGSGTSQSARMGIYDTAPVITQATVGNWQVTDQGLAAGAICCPVLNVGDGATAGIRIDPNGIAGYNASSAAKQFYLDPTTGAGMCGAGKVIMDANGVALTEGLVGGSGVSPTVGSAIIWTPAGYGGGSIFNLFDSTFGGADQIIATTGGATVTSKCACGSSRAVMEQA